ncbi:soluble quino protein glucose dehydrogenase [Rickenella mellea]|uniref:Soluble quino protein glucose dehydrogenase n=1 Tax=Rickenella mellea TaxID=50990 RepID=A0A4Y7QNR8_9AGAM|nr:soluble quino protein glucose dehydrogenase [Rickenella mellea]
MNIPVFMLLCAALVNAQCESSKLKFRYSPTFSSGLSGHVIYNSLTKPRSIKFDSASPPNLLVVDSGVGVVALMPKNDTCKGWDKKVLIQNTNLNHGLEIQGSQLFASTPDVVMVWNYNATSVSVSGNPQTIVQNMTNTDHNTRTLLWQQGQGNGSPQLIVTRGSSENVDAGAADLTTGRSQIRRFGLNSSIPSGGWDWFQGELLSWGMRNAVGISFSQDGSGLWEVENSADDVQYQSVDVHEDNPAEELNFIDISKPSGLGQYYGYPDCLTVWNMTADGGPSTLTTGDQFSIQTTGGRDDAWCKNEAQNTRPTLSFQAHSAPLDIKFYTAPANASPPALQNDWNTHAFVSFHGSWDRTKPTGYSVVRIPWSGNAPKAKRDAGNGYDILVQPPDLSKCNQQCIRPVGLAFDSSGILYVSSDATGEVFVIEATSPASKVAPYLLYVFLATAVTHIIMSL